MTPAPAVQSRAAATDPAGDRTTSRTRLYLGLFLVGLAANLLSSHSHRVGLPVSPDRILLPLAVVLLWLDPGRPRARWGVVPALMAVFIGWTVISMVWHGNVLNSSPLFALLDRTVMPFLMFLLGPLIFTTTERRDLLLKSLTIMGLYLGITAILEQWAPQVVFPRYIVDPQVGMHFGRSRGPFAGAEAMAMALAVCAGAALLLRSRRAPRWSALSLIVAGLCMFGVVLTTTRSVWVGVAAGVLVALVLSPELRRWIPAMGIAAAAGAAGVIFLLPSLRDSILERSLTAGPIYDRLSSNAAALRVLEDLPLTGIGWRRFYPHGGEWARQSDEFPLNNAVIEVHNVVLSRAVELGLPAVLVFLLIIILGPVRSALPAAPLPGHPDLPGWRVLSGYVVSVWLVAGLFGPLSNPFPNYSVWLIAGVASLALLYGPHGESQSQQRARRRGAHRRSDPSRLP